jgi:hypothetical protein
MKKTTHVGLGLAVFSLVLLPQCDLFKSSDAAKPAAKETSAPAQSSAPADSSEVLMSIGGKPAITQDSFESYMADFLEAQPQYKQIVEFMPDAKRNIFDGQVNEEIIGAWADKNNIDKKAEYQKDRDKIIKFAERSLKVKYFQDAYPTEVSPVEVRKYYDENKNSQQLMKSPGGVKAEAIMLTSKAKAEELLDKVKAGSDFKKVAQDASLKVKDLGLVSDQSFDVEGPIREAILAVTSFPKNEVVKVSDKLFALVHASSKQQPEYVAFEEVKEGIANFLKQQKMAEEIQKVLQKLRKQYEIVINEEFFDRDKKAKEEAAKAMQTADAQDQQMKSAAKAGKPLAA